MQKISIPTFDELVEQYLRKSLPRQFAGTISLSELSPDARGFMTRALELMKKGCYSASEFNPALIRWLFTTVPSIMPSAWGGRIPPLTLPGRHKKLDDYVANQTSATADQPPVFVDVGCGFPPVTSADTARRFADWHIYGVDTSFDDYVLYDRAGHYACFDRQGVFQYFQALMNPSGRALYADSQKTKNQFNELFEDLFPLLRNPNGTRSESVEKDGNRLIHNHIRDFETDNLSFVESDIGELQLPPAQVIRCMNVLLYFAPETRKKMLERVGELLDDDGILIAGTNGLGLQFRYTVYRKGTHGLSLDEFALSMDNLGHIVFMPFLTFHENDPEATLLAELTGTIKSDRSFWPDFSNRQDELLKQYGICQRKSEGFLQFPEEEISPAEYVNKISHLWREMETEGYLDGAVKALEQGGYEAWKNSVGDIAIRPAAEAGL